jgi:hypothetical protein
MSTGVTTAATFAAIRIKATTMKVEGRSKARRAIYSAMTWHRSQRINAVSGRDPVVMVKRELLRLRAGTRIDLDRRSDRNRTRGKIETPPISRIV